MSAHAFHPEELLDRLAVELLGAAQRVALVAHARTCAVCRFEVRVRADFAEELERGEIDAGRDPESAVALPIVVRAVTRSSALGRKDLP